MHMKGHGKSRGTGLARLALPGLAVVVASLLLASKATVQRIGNPVVPEPLKPVDLPRYLGRWYEFARYDNRFEWHCEAVTAEYFQRPDGLIGIAETPHAGAVLTVVCGWPRDAPKSCPDRAMPNCA